MLREFAKSLRIRCLTPLLYLLPALLPAGRASAGPLLFTLSSPDDLGSLTVGQTAHFDITLSGLAAVEQLVTLTGGVTFNTPLLGAPTAVHAGSIVPHPLANLLDFQTFSAPGEADASFLTFSSNTSEQIISNGIFYGFDVEARTAGTGTLQFDPLALIGEQFDPTNLNLPILRFIDTGPALTFTIKAASGGGGGASVPLPNGMRGMIALVMAIAVILISRKKSGRPGSLTNTF